MLFSNAAVSGSSITWCIGGLTEIGNRGEKDASSGSKSPQASASGMPITAFDEIYPVHPIDIRASSAGGMQPGQVD
jgi:hypothetical protein